MKKITKFLMTSVLLLTGAYGINNFNETKEVEAAGVTMTGGEEFYLTAGGWDVDGARFAIYFYGDGEAWVSMTDANDDNVYEAVTPEGSWTNLIFVRLDGSNEENTWTNQWGQTYNLEYDGTNNHYTITTTYDSENKGVGNWSVYYYNPTNFSVNAAAVENDGTINNAVKVVSALPAGTEAKKNASEEYNVGLKFEFTPEASLPDTIGGTTFYLNPNSNWKQSNARFAIYVFNSSGNAWASMTDTDADGIYEVVAPEGSWTNLIFCRMNPSDAANNWDNKWNQTSDLTYDPAEGNCYKVASGTWDYGNGTWSIIAPSVETKTGYYTCANISLVEGVTFDYEVETYFAVIVTDIPTDYNGGTMKVTPAYQSLNGETIWGIASTWTLAVTSAGVTIA